LSGQRRLATVGSYDHPLQAIVNQYWRQAWLTWAHRSRSRAATGCSICLTTR
jgi:hypothetical protein